MEVYCSYAGDQVAVSRTGLVKYQWLISVLLETPLQSPISGTHSVYYLGTSPLFLFKNYWFIILKINLFNWRLITLQYCSGFWHTLTWLSHGHTCVPHPEPPSHLLPHPIPQGHPSAPALSTLSYVLNPDQWSASHMIIYTFQCYPLKSSHPCLLPQSPKDCSLHLCLFCCLGYIVIVTIFLNSIYMH